MKLTNKQFNSLLKTLNTEREDDCIVVFGRFKGEIVSFDCDEEANDFDFNEMCYRSRKGDIVELEFSNEQLELLKQEARDFITNEEVEDFDPEPLEEFELRTLYTY